MDQLNKLLQESYRTTRALTPPAGSWERLAQDIATRKRRRRMLCWFLGSLLTIGFGMYAFWGYPPTLGAFPIPVTGKSPQAAAHQAILATKSMAATTLPTKLVAKTIASPPNNSGQTSPSKSASLPFTRPSHTAFLDTPTTPQSVIPSNTHSPDLLSPPVILQSDRLAQDHPFTAKVPSMMALEARPPSIVAQATDLTLPAEALQPVPGTTIDQDNARMEEAKTPPPPRKNVWRFFAGTQQQMEGIVLMTYTDYPRLRGQLPFKQIDDTDLYQLTFARGYKRTNYLEIGAALQRYHNERFSFNYQISLLSGDFTSEVLEPYLRVFTEHYREISTTRIHALQVEYGIAWDWLHGPRLRLAPYAGLLYQLTLQTAHQSTFRIPGQNAIFNGTTDHNPPHVTNELRLRLGALIQLPLKRDWAISVSSGVTTEFLDVARPAFYGNVGIGKAF